MTYIHSAADWKCVRVREEIIKWPNRCFPLSCNTEFPWWREAVIHVALLGLRFTPIVDFDQLLCSYVSLFSKMRLAAEEKVELGFAQQMTVNPAFEVREMFRLLINSSGNSQCETLGEGWNSHIQVFTKCGLNFHSEIKSSRTENDIFLDYSS